jgi:hypothetical protein
VLTASTSILATLLGNGVWLDPVKVSIVDVSLNSCLTLSPTLYH